MSAIPGSRPAVFTQHSQHCEVFVEGAWWPGSLLGWRHDGQGACQVRVTVAGVDRETWTDLVGVRLPETRPAPPLVPDGDIGPFASLGEELLPGASAVPLLSLSEAAAREQRVAGVLPASAPVAGRRRHGADVTAEQPALPVGAAAGRHRAGRHRAADAPEEPEQAPAPAPGDATVLMARATEADCLTRPLRLATACPAPASCGPAPRSASETPALRCGSLPGPRGRPSALLRRPVTPDPRPPRPLRRVPRRVPGAAVTHACGWGTRTSRWGTRLLSACRSSRAGPRVPLHLVVAPL